MAGAFGSLFGKSSAKPSASTLKAQRRQERQIQDQTADEAKEAGSRRRLQASRRRTGGTLYQQTGGAGVKETLG